MNITTRASYHRRSASIVRAQQTQAPHHAQHHGHRQRRGGQSHTWASVIVSTVTAAVITLQVGNPALAAIEQTPDETFENIPGQLRSDGDEARNSLRDAFAGENKRSVEACTRKCLPACIRGGEGSPGLGPLTMRKEIIVFKEGFRTRQYCLQECAQACSKLVQAPGS